MTSINLLTLPGKLWSMNGSTSWLTTKLDTENSMVMQWKGTSACTVDPVHAVHLEGNYCTHGRLAQQRLQSRAEAHRVTRAHAA